jgi:hypothetical protein
VYPVSAQQFLLPKINRPKNPQKVNGQKMPLWKRPHLRLGAGTGTGTGAGTGLGAGTGAGAAPVRTLNTAKNNVKKRMNFMLALKMT